MTLKKHIRTILIAKIRERIFLKFLYKCPNLRVQANPIVKLARLTVLMVQKGNVGDHFSPCF